LGEGGDPPTVVTEEPLAPPAPAQPERSQRARRPPRYLADYAVGHLELPPCDGSPSNTDDYPILVGNSLDYPGEFHQEEEMSDRVSEGTRLRELSFRNSMEFPMGRVTRTLAGNNSEARGSAITTLAITLAARIPGANSNLNFNFILSTLASVMGITLPEAQSEERIEIEEVSRTDSPPPPAPALAPSNQQDATLPSVVRSTSISSPVSKPVKFQLAAREEQGILHGDHPAGTDKREDSADPPTIAPSPAKCDTSLPRVCPR